MDLDDLDEIITAVAAREVLPRFGRLAAADVQVVASDPGRMGGGLLCATDEGSWHALRDGLLGSAVDR